MITQIRVAVVAGIALAGYGISRLLGHGKPSGETVAHAEAAAEAAEPSSHPDYSGTAAELAGAAEALETPPAPPPVTSYPEGVPAGQAPSAPSAEASGLVPQTATVSHVTPDLAAIAAPIFAAPKKAPTTPFVADATGAPKKGFVASLHVTGEDMIYETVSGDRPGSIASRFKISIADLADANPEHAAKLSRGRCKPGWKLRIPQAV